MATMMMFASVAWAQADTPPTNFPVVTSVSPDRGGPAEDVPLYVLVKGSNLDTATAVTFGGVSATYMMWVPEQQELFVGVPIGSGVVDVLVTTPAGTSAPNANARFTYVGPPEITSVTVNPNGMGVQIQGRNLLNIMSITLGGAEAYTFGRNTDGTSDGTTAWATWGANSTPGNPVSVAVMTAIGTAYGSGAWPTVPSVSALSPAQGPVAGGTAVTMSGADFVPGATSVTIGGVQVPASSVSVNGSTSLTFTTPAHAAGNVEVTVSTPGGTSGAAPGGFTYQAANLPVVTGMTPNRGGPSGGEPFSVQIRGSNLASALRVTFGGVESHSVGWSEGLQTLHAIVPPGSGVVDVLVTTTAGTSAPNADAKFTYYGPPEITSVTVNPYGREVQIQGRDLFNITSVTLGGVGAATFSANAQASDDGMSAWATWSADSNPGDPVSVSVTTPFGTANASGAWPTAPTASLSPAIGPSAGGTVVTATGLGFVSGATSVTIGGVDIPAASVSVSSPTSLTFTTPAHAPGNVEVVVRMPGGVTATVPGGFTYQASNPPVVTGMSRNHGLYASDAAVILFIYGTGLANTTGVTFGGVSANDVFWSEGLQALAVTIPNNSGTVDVIVTTPEGSSAPSAASRFTYMGPPEIHSLTVEPTRGRVTIHGRNLIDLMEVQVGGDYASSFSRNTGADSDGTTAWAAWSGTASVQGGVYVSLLTLLGRAEASAPWPAAPTVSGLSPAQGPLEGGTSVTITGDGFMPSATSVTINGIDITGSQVLVHNGNSLTFTTPAHAAGTVEVKVNTHSGTSSAVPGGFTYRAAATPPIAGAVSAEVAYGSADNAIPLVLTGGAATAVAISTPPTHGVATADGTAIVYTPNPGHGGADSFAYSATNADGTSAPATVTIVVTPPTLALDTTALPDARTGAGYSQTRAASGGTGPYVYSIATGALPAGLTIDAATGTLAGSPTTPGTSAFTLRATDSSTGSGPYAVDQAFSITVAAATPPVVGPVAITVEYGSAANAIQLDLSGGAAESLTITTAASHGVATVSGTAITYTPNSNYSGSDSFTYTATNADGTSAPASVTVTVLPAPVAPPIAGPVSVTVARDSTDNPVPLNLSGGAVTGVVVINQPLYGMAAALGTSIVYTPAPGFSGADNFTYMAVNGAGTSTPATVTIPVSAAPPPPPPGPPSPDPMSASVPFGSTGTAITPTFASGSVTAVAVAAPPSHGTVSVSGLGFTYVPNATYQGQDSFTFVAEGPGGVSAPVTVTLTVQAPQPPTIDTPAGPVIVPTPPAGTSTFSIDLGALVQGPIDGFRITGAAGNGTAEIVSGSAASQASTKSDGRLSAVGGYRLVYRPSATFLGTDALTLVAVGPGGESRPLTFVFQVTGKAPDLSGQVAAGEVLELAPTTGLTGGPFQAVRITRAPDVGTAVVRGQTIVFTAGTAIGATWLEYVIDLPFGASAAGRIDLVTQSVPQSQRLVATTRQGQPVSVVISGAAGGPFIDAAVVSVGPTTAGNAVITVSGADRILTFTPSGSFADEATVTYSLTNAFATRDGTLAVTVEPRPDPALDPDVRGIASAQASATRRTAEAQVGNFRRRLQVLRNGRNGSSNGLRLNLGMGLDGQNDPRQALNRQLGRSTDGLAPGEEDRRRDWERLQQDRWVDHAPDAAVDTLSAAQTMGSTTSPAREPLFGAWAAGSVDLGRQDASGLGDTRITTQGVSGGLDARLSDSLILGAGAGYGEDRARIGDAGTTAETRAVTAAVYGSWRPLSRFYVDGVAGYASLDIDTRRMTGPADDPLTMRAEGTRSGDMRFASVALGRDFDRRGMSGDIYLRLDARQTDLEVFTETGAGTSNLTWNALRQDSLSAGFGGSIRWRLETRRHGLIEPSLSLEWARELEDVGVQDVRYSDWLSSPDYPIVLDGWSRQSLRLDLGLGWSLTDRLSLDLSYRGMLGDASSSHGGQIGLTYGW